MSRPLRIGKIAVGVAFENDGEETPGTRRALERAVLLAETSGAAVELVHAAPWLASSVQDPDARARERAAVRMLERESERFESCDVRCSCILVPGSAGVALKRAAAVRAADLVVVGRYDAERAERGPGHALLGSTARELIAECSAPTWIVQPTVAPSARAVLAATDLGEVGVRVLAWARMLAATFGAELHVLHAWRRPYGASAAGEVPDPAADRRLREQALRSIERQLEIAGVELERARIHVAGNNPLRALRESVARMRPEVLVLGSLSKTGLPGMVLGNTAQGVLEQIDCSLLVIKPEGVEARLARGA